MNAFSLIIISIIVCIGVGSSLTGADLPLNVTDLPGNRSTGDLPEFSESAGMNASLNQVLPGVIPNETSVIGAKAPRSNLTFSSLMNSTSNISGNQSSVEDLEGQENLSGNLSVNTSLSKYESLGDIIRAKDWKALGEYQCKIKAESSASLTDSGIDTGNQEAKWNGYFNYREPVVTSYPCCG